MFSRQKGNVHTSMSEHAQRYTRCVRPVVLYNHCPLLCSPLGNVFMEKHFSHYALYTR